MLNMFKSLFSFLLLICFVSNVVAVGVLFNEVNVTELGIVINSLLASLKYPLKLTTMICWDQAIAYNFIAAFMLIQKNNLFQINRKEVNVNDIPKNDNQHQEIILIDLFCDDTEDLLFNTTNELYWQYKWIIIDSNGNNETIIEKVENLFQELPILPSSEIFYLYANNSTDYQIKQMYRTTVADKDLIHEFYGIWSNDTLYDFRPTKVTSRRRLNLNKSMIKASLVITDNDTLQHLSDYENKHIDTITKVTYLLTNYLIDYMNATVNYSIVDTWGYLDKETGVWNGMIGELVRSEAEIGATALFFTNDRLEIIEYISMPTPTRSKFVFRSPKLSYTDNVFLLPFNQLVWFCLVILIIIVSCFLLITIIIEWRFTKIQNTDDSTIECSSVGDILFIVFCAVCQQGSSVLPRNFSSRIITIVCFIVLMFLYTSYSANIVALLQAPSTKIRTLEDLLNSRLKLGVHNTIFNNYYFSHEKDKIRKLIYEQKILQKNGNANFMEIEDGVEKLRKGLFAFHMELGVGYKLISETFYEDEKCGLQEIQYLQVIDPWYAIKKRSSYKEIFKIGMLRMREHGIQDRENSRLYTKRPKCSGNNAHFVTVSLVDIHPAMLMLAWGVFLTSIIFICEIVLNKIF